ncbi:MAG TPA: SelB C-terminal domain-containing protein, partial [Anaerolineales bacterium]
PEPSAEEVAQAIQAAQAGLWRMGLTGVHDFDRRRCFMALQALGAAPLKDVLARSNLNEAATQGAVTELFATNQIIFLENSAAGPDGKLISERSSLISELVTGKGYWDQLAARAVQEVESYHRANPLRPGMPREELKSRLKPLTKGAVRLFNAAYRRLIEQRALEEAGPLVRRPGFAIRFSPQHQASIDRLMARFAASRYAPPSVKEAQAEVGEDIFNALLDQGRLVSVAADVVFRPEDYNQMLAEVHILLEKQGTLTAAQVRDHFNTSRRYVLAFLEHLDATGVTVREGDVRRLKHSLL